MYTIILFYHVQWPGKQTILFQQKYGGKHRMSNGNNKPKYATSTCNNLQEHYNVQSSKPLSTIPPFRYTYFRPVSVQSTCSS